MGSETIHIEKRLKVYVLTEVHLLLLLKKSWLQKLGISGLISPYVGKVFRPQHHYSNPQAGYIIIAIEQMAKISVSDL